MPAREQMYFFIRRDSCLAVGGKAMAYFISKRHDVFACLAGTAQVDQDRAMIEKLWPKPAEARFPGGRDDPDLALLRFDITDAELWESDMTLGGKLKMLFGGTITPHEAGSHAKVSSAAV